MECEEIVYYTVTIVLTKRALTNWSIFGELYKVWKPPLPAREL